MRTFIAALTLAVTINALELGVDTEVSAEAQAMANAVMINDYIMAQVERINAESDAAEFA